MTAIGIDAGSLTAKIAVLGEDGSLWSAVIRPGDLDNGEAGKTLQEIYPGASREDCRVVSTGAGGKTIRFSHEYKSITTCLARAINHLLPEARTVIDMGAETITVLRVNERGRVTDYGNQDKCAAGTGIFLQQVGKILRLSPEQMAGVSAASGARVEITGTCAVFAESEIISHIHRDPPTPVEDIVAGIYRSMARRIMAQLQRIGVKADVAVTGGLANNIGLVRVLEEEMGQGVIVPPRPELAGAIGAALIARENMAKGSGS